MTDTYKIHDTGHWMFPYAVVDPTGWLVAVTSTRWGARRAVAKDILKRQRPARVDGYWTKPVVDEIPSEPGRMYP